MKILFFTENFPPETNAAATRVFERALYWVKWGHEVTIITCQPNFPHGKIFDGYINRFAVEEMSGIRVVRVRTYIAANRGVLNRTFDFLSFMVSGYLAARNEPKPDVVISTSPQFFAAVAAWWFAKKRNLPYVFELGDLWPASIAAVGAVKNNFALSLIEKLELRMYRDADAVIALTQSFKDNLVQRGIDTQKIAVVINGVDLWRYGPRDRHQDFLKEARIPDGACVIAYVGTHGMAHALGNVLEAAKRLKDRSDIVFLFVGAGAERESLIEKAQRHALENVRFIGSQPKERMADVWSVADVALVHLKNDAVFEGVIPSKIFEAMGMGLAIIFAGPTGEGSKIIVEADAGLVVTAEDPISLSRAVSTMAEDPEKRKKFAAHALAAAPRYSREAQASHMMNVLKMVVSGDGRPVTDVRPDQAVEP